MSRSAEMVLPAPSASRRPNAAWAESLESRLQTDWRPGEWDALSWTFLGDPDNPKTWVFPCTIPGCGSYSIQQGVFCTRCRRNYIKQGHPADFATSFRPTRPVPDPDAPRRIRLAGLRHSLRVELLFALQAYAETRTLVPGRLAPIFQNFPPGAESLLTLPDRFALSLRKTERGLFRALHGVVIRDRVAFEGIDVTADDVWDCGLVGLMAGSHRPYVAQLGTVLDFRPVHHQWLRELVKEFIRSTRVPVHRARPLIQACAIASRGLLARPDGDDPERLGRADMTAIIDFFETLEHDDGKPVSGSHRAALFQNFQDVLRFARRSGLMDHVPGTFEVETRTNLKRRKTPDVEDMAGRALPAHVVAQLDAHLHLLGAESSFESVGWSADDLRLMHRTIYQILRDTGRRPDEVNSLKRDCLRWVDGKPSLIYDNKKAHRFGRRLPIAESTAAVIQQWRDHFDQLAVTAESPWLFPAPGSRGQLRRGADHIRNWGARTFRNWVDAIPALTDAGLDSNGLSVPFPRDAITPYAFRHTYAQRHADAGTPVDVLRQLMDHVSVETTMGYYKVTMSRREEAVATVSALVMDRHGRRLPQAEQVDYEMGTVAVPFGNCAEPSNVKAGGGHCPIRFQCAGCTFYRPDPSHLPALEAHVAELRVNKEHAIATDAAGWVVTNLQDQVDAFSTVAKAMHTLLDQLPDDDRQAVEAASAEVRKLRQLQASMLGRTA